MNEHPIRAAFQATFLALTVAGCGGITATSSPSPPPVETSMPTRTASPSATMTTVPTPTPTPSPTPSLRDYFQEVSRHWRVAYFDKLNNRVCAMYGDGSAKICLDFSRLADGYASKGFLSWSPDGGKLAVATECSIHIWTPGEGLSSLRDGQTCGVFREAKWSPGGSFIAYVSEELQRSCPFCQAFFSDLFLDSLDGTVHRSIRADFEGSSDSPAWSPDGRSIAFAFSPRIPEVQANYLLQNEEIFVYSVDENQAINLTQNPARDVDPAWSPDSQLIAFLSDRGGAFDLYTMHSDGSGTLKVAQLGVDYHWPYSSYLPIWLPDGEHILYLDNLINVETEVITPLDFGFDTTYATWFAQSEGASVLPLPTPHCASGWSQLYPGIYAVVTGGADDPPNRVRSSPDTSAEIVDQIYPGDIVLVASGPACVDGLVFWKVEHKSIPGGEGWTAEGDGVDYFLEPYVPQDP